MSKSHTYYDRTRVVDLTRSANLQLRQIHSKYPNCYAIQAPTLVPAASLETPKQAQNSACFRPFFMESSTQEDSLVFAASSKPSKPSWPWSDPLNNPEKTADDTLVDRAENAAENDSFLLSRSGDSPPISHLYSSDFLRGEHSNRGYDTLGDTQVIRRNAYDTGSEAETSFSEKNVQISPFQDTQVIPQNRRNFAAEDLADTQVIGQRLLGTSLSFAGEDTAEKTAENGHSSTDNGKSGTTTNTPDSQILPQNDTQGPAPAHLEDTQKIEKGGSFLADTQPDSLDVVSPKARTWSNYQDTQVIQRSETFGPLGPTFLNASVIKQTQSLEASPFLAYQPTQQDRGIAGLVIDSSPTKVGEITEEGAQKEESSVKAGFSDPFEGPESRDDVHIGDTSQNSANAVISQIPQNSYSSYNSQTSHNSSSQNSQNPPSPRDSQNSKNSHNSPKSPSPAGSVTFDTSFDDPSRLEPTTQVLNTQEEYMDHEYEKPVDLSCKPIFSSSQNDDARKHARIGIESDDENHSFDDSIVHAKRRKVALSSSSQSNGRGSSKVLERGDEKMEDMEKTAKTGDIKPIEKVEKMETPRHSPVLAPNDTMERESSSELEDISQDVTGIDLDALSKTLDSTLLPGTPKREKTAKPEKSRPVPETLRAEVPANCSRDVVKDVNAVWALHSFQKVPAKVVQYGEVFSLVQFSKTVQTEARNSDLHLLDICVGDTVQLKNSHGNYVVVGLTFYTPESTIRCIRGYDTAILVKKARVRQNEFMVSLEEICMQMDKWAVHQQKFHILQDGVDLLSDNYALVRQIMDSENIAKMGDVPNIEHKLDKQVSPRKAAKEFVAARKSDIFAGMLFFVTSIEGARKERLKEKIVSNGGSFLDDEIKHFTARESSDGLFLAAEKSLTSYKFGALLSDGYSRSAKYLQALTLGWPILADCFVDKVVENRAFLENWPVFLLPAGHSSYTQAVTNLDVYDFRAKFNSGCFLSEQLQNNAQLLAGYTIVVLDRKQDSKMLDMCDFIFHAFGAYDIQRVRSPKDVDCYVKELISSRFLIYDNSQNEYYTHGSKPRAGRSSKSKIGVVDWEWVVQCVISKYIWEPGWYVEL